MLNELLSLYDASVLNSFIKSLKILRYNPELFKRDVFYIFIDKEIYEIGNAKKEETYKEILKEHKKNDKATFFIKFKTNAVIESKDFIDCIIYAVFNGKDIIQFTRDKDDWLIIEPQFQDATYTNQYHYRAFTLLSKKNEIV